jgi:hypothetical protein
MTRREAHQRAGRRSDYRFWKPNSVISFQADWNFRWDAHLPFRISSRDVQKSNSNVTHRIGQPVISTISMQYSFGAPESSVTDAKLGSGSEESAMQYPSSSWSAGWLQLLRFIPERKADKLVAQHPRTRLPKPRAFETMCIIASCI